MKGVSNATVRDPEFTLASACKKGGQGDSEIHTASTFSGSDPLPQQSTTCSLSELLLSFERKKKRKDLRRLETLYNYPFDSDFL